MNNNIEIITPQKHALKIETDKPIKVCAYCRVSTDEENQRNSLKSQKMFFDNIFNKHKNWTNVGIFADEGLSGTSLEKRDSFNKMLRLARNGAIDVIFTKEVSRFSRNTQHLLNIVEELRDKGVYIWFLSDDIYTEKNDYREHLTQIATNAEQESLKTSRRVRWGQAEQMQRGVVFGRKEMFGYNIVKDQNGIQHFEIIPEEAEAIKNIFKWFAAGDGTYRIARRLEEQGITTKGYKNGWSNTVILRILRNEKYVGDLAQGKTYTPNPLNHKKKYNTGEATKYYIKNHHPEEAIIDRETWDIVQNILQEKAPSEEIKAKHSNRYWTSGKIYCGICGGRYVSYNKKQKNIPYKAWVCFENHQRGKQKEIEINGERVLVGCNGKRVNDRILQMALYDIITQVIKPNTQQICNEVIKQIQVPQKSINYTQKIKSKENAISKIERDISILTKKYLQEKISETAYRLTEKDLNDELQQIITEVNTLKNEQYETVDSKELSAKFINQIKKIASLKEKEINERLYERITKKIVVYPNNILEIQLSFLPKPIKLKYSTFGRGEKYGVNFDII